MDGRGLFRAMLIVGVLANLGLIIAFAVEKKDTGLISSWETYTSQAAGCSMVYPQGWRVKEIDRQGVELEIRFSPSPDSYVAAVNSLTGTLVMDILKASRKVESPLRVFHENLVEGMKKKAHRFEVSETTEMKVAGAEAYSTTFKYRTWDGFMGRSMEAMLVSTSNGDNYVGLKYVCPVGEHDKMFGAFGSFIAGFKPHGTVGG